MSVPSYYEEPHSGAINQMSTNLQGHMPHDSSMMSNNIEMINPMSFASHRSSVPQVSSQGIAHTAMTATHPVAARCHSTSSVRSCQGSSNVFPLNTPRQSTQMGERRQLLGNAGDHGEYITLWSLHWSYFYAKWLTGTEEENIINVFKSLGYFYKVEDLTYLSAAHCILIILDHCYKRMRLIVPA